MSKARKRHRQPYWKRAHTNRQRVRAWLLRVKRGLIKPVRFDELMRGLYPKEIG